MGDRSISEGFSLVYLWTHGLLTITIDDEAALILRWEENVGLSMH